jgi:hypothetical protein
MERAREDVALRHATMRAWREAHGEVVAAAQMIHLAAGEDSAQADALLAHFAAEDVLLELVTDEHDDGWQLAAEFVEQVSGEPVRERLRMLLAGWAADVPRTDQSLRVVIFGGHPRDETRLAPLFAGGPFELRWRIWEKRQGDSVDTRLVTDALTSADAAIIVTGMASHNIMELVRRFAKKRELPWTCIEKATDTQLKAALNELFPEPK